MHFAGAYIHRRMKNLNGILVCVVWVSSVSQFAARPLLYVFRFICVCVNIKLSCTCIYM